MSRHFRPRSVRAGSLIPMILSGPVSHTLGLAVVLAVLSSLMLPIAVLASSHTATPIDQPADFAAVRASFEGMSVADVEAAGYVADPPECVSSPAGGMGIHAVNGQLIGQQFPSGTMDPENPPIVLLDSSMTTVIGLEWEAQDIGQGETTLFGQPVVIQPGHPGAEEDHYMLHAYFRPNGQVLFAPFDPEVTCPLPDAAMEQPDSMDLSLVYVGVGVIVFGALFAARRLRHVRRSGRA